MRPWHEREGTAAELHALDVAASGSSVWSMRVTEPAVVLGSAQPDDAVLDEGELAWIGLERARRRSGGGVVLVEPEHTRWLDVVIAPDDVAFDDDVHRAAAWLGQRWVAALADVGIRGLVHAGPMVEPRLGRMVCFAGTGAGEVVVAGRKVVGISQRRDRRGARFQCVAYVDWQPATLVGVLGPATASHGPEIAARLEEAAGPIGPRLDRAVERLVDDLRAG